MVSARGPIPKRSFERRRRNVTGDVDTIQAVGPVRIPGADRTWDPLARDFYRALATSPQRVYFEATDWQYAKVAATALSGMLTCAGSGNQPGRRVRNAELGACPRCGRLAKITGAEGRRVFERHRRGTIVAEVLRAWDDMTKRLLITEPDRRRNRIEIVRQLEEDNVAGPVSITGYRAALAGDQVVDTEEDNVDDGEDYE